MYTYAPSSGCTCALNSGGIAASMKYLGELEEEMYGYPNHVN